MPDLKYDALDAIPEDLRGEAKQVDGKFVVSVVPAKRLAEFRDNNVRLLQEKDSLTARVTTYASLVGDDPTKFQAELGELRTTAQLVKDGKLKGTDAIEAEVVNRSKAKTESLETQIRDTATKLNAETTEKNQWKQKYERSVLHQQITNAVVGKDSVANPEALPDILSRAESLFVVQPDGTIVPKKGDAIIYGSDGASPMSPKEWLTKLVAESPYLGKASAGGGANGNRDGDASFGGLPQAEFLKLPPAERIRRHRESQARK